MAETMSCDEALKAAFPSIEQDEAVQGEFSHFLVTKDLLPAITHYLHTATELAWQADTLMGCRRSPRSRRLWIALPVHPGSFPPLGVVIHGARGERSVVPLHHAAHSCR